MSQTAFDASGFLRFDLESGRIRSAMEEDLTLVPRRLLGLLTPGERLVAAGREWGRLHGEGLAREKREAPIEVLADSLGGLLAMAGMGRVSVEIRGDALLLRAAPPADSTPETAAASRDLMAGFIAGFLTGIDPAGFDVLTLSGDSGEQLFWAGGPRAVARVRGWMTEGMEPLAALDRLSRGGAP